MDDASFDARAYSPPDLLHGVKAIAASLGMTTNQVYHLHSDGTLPTFKIGRAVCARRSSLTAWLAEQEQKAREQDPP